jgi:hypothetical protein
MPMATSMSGEWRDGKKNGQGTYYFLADNQFKGDKYVGEHRDGKRHGQGTYTWANGDKHVGEHRDGWSHGQGIFTYADGRPPQEGVWEKDKFVRAERIPDHIAGRTSPASPALVQAAPPPTQTVPPLAQAPRQAEPPRSTLSLSTSAYGQSTLPACDPNYPRTGWTNCQGTYEIVWGNKYVGEFRDGKFHGQGAYIYASGDKWVGEFRDGNRHGQGTHIYTNGNKYVGEYKDGYRNGQGTYTFANGNKYVGEFRDGKRHGQGILIYADGRPPREGTWKKDKFVRAQRIPDHIAGRTSPASPALVQAAPPPTQTVPPLAQAPRQAEPPRSTLSLSASASQPDPNGVVTLTITTNSDTASLKINGDEAGGRADGRYSVRKFAQVGDNRFEVVAVDRSGNTQSQTVTVVRQPADNVARFAALNPLTLKARPPRDAVAVIIGIQDYRRVSKADFANNDARLFYDYAIRGLGVRPENIKLLLDDKADDIEILGAFKNWLPVKTRKGQTDVYVFYSGHGYPSDDGASLYFLPHGVDRQFLDRSAIKQSDIVLALQAARLMVPTDPIRSNLLKRRASLQNAVGYDSLLCS